MRPITDNRTGFELVRATNPTQDSLIGALAERLRSGRGFAVATVNLDHMVKLRRDATFRAAYARHSHIVADGNPVVWLHRMAGWPVDLVTGSDLIDPLMDLARRYRVPVAFFGSTRQALDIAAERLGARHPGLEIVVRLSPDFGFEPEGAEADEGIAKIEAAGARLCLVALGAPKQELFVARAVDRMPDCGFVSVGAGLDFVAGTQRRAPRWWRRLALEWLWRLASDRRRLTRRYWDCVLILPGLAVAALRERFRGPDTDARPPAGRAPRVEPMEE